MPCEKCNHKLVLENKGKELICPKCEGWNILTKEVGLVILKKRVDWLNNAFMQILARFDKRRLIGWLTYYREQMVADFFRGKPYVPIRDFLAATALIKRVMRNYDEEGSEEADDKNTPELINAFGFFIKNAEDFGSVNEDYAYVIANGSFEISDLETKDHNWLMKNFYVVHNEDWKIILNTLSQHNIVNKEEADRYLKQNAAEYKKATKNPKSKHFTVEETIEKIYPTMMQFLYGLQLNSYFKEVFNFDYLKETDITPKHILNMVTPLREVVGHINTTKPRDFKNFIKFKLKDLDVQTTFDSLVFSKDNKDIFPFFVLLDGHLFTPINTIKVIALYLYPFIHQKEFIKIHNQKSEEFEKEEVKKLMEEAGFKVFLNYTDKKKATLEIDNLAFREDTLLVEEVKAWDIKPFFEKRRIHEYRERDLKGVVDGIKYTAEKEKEIPSLLNKIKFIEENLDTVCQKCGFDKEKIKKIKGIVITKSFPPITEYKDISFISKAQIKDV